MTTLECWLCSTPPGTLARQYLQALCVCGFELRYHGYGHPHSMGIVDCAAFLAAVPTPPPTTDAQPALF
jgi:hypothetical protein